MTRAYTVRFASLLSLALFTAGASAGEYEPLKEKKIKKLDRVTQTLVDPPMFPKHDQVAGEAFKVVEIYLPIEEKKITIDDNGTEIWALTYNGTVPGPMIVVHEGDYLEFTLHNKSSSTMEHNIDFHSSTGALGAGGLSHVQPGEQVVIRFRATKSGTYVYHCAPGGAMIPWHVVHGMNGAITVLPREGLTDGAGKALTYDRAYYIGEQDFYVPKAEDGTYKSYETPMAGFAEEIEVMNTLIPSHIVFNGKVGALTGDNALTANVGETVLFVHSQANYDTRPHIIGGHGEYVWAHGSFANDPVLDLETWFIPGGTAGAALYTFKQPGVYAYVNHNLIEAVLKGATGHIMVEGDWNDDLMKQMSKPAKAEEEAEAETKE
jgi:nitrite reductase (NO-forming)